MTIKNVAIVGGTHGNELTGTYLLKRWKQNPDEVTRSTFATHLFFGNPKAFSENRRFIDEDLNRCFSIDALLATEIVSYEANRAAVLNQAIGPKGRPQHDVVIDLHTSTSNCGGMIILLSDDAFNLRLAAHLSILVPKSTDLLYSAQGWRSGLPWIDMHGGSHCRSRSGSTGIAALRHISSHQRDRHTCTRLHKPYKPPNHIGSTQANRGSGMDG